MKTVILTAPGMSHFLFPVWNEGEGVTSNSKWTCTCTYRTCAQGRIQHFWKRGSFEGVWVRFPGFISFFLNIPWKWNNLVSLRPNYSIFIGYLKTGGGGGGGQANPLWICHWRYILHADVSSWARSLVWVFIYIGTFCAQAAKARASLLIEQTRLSLVARDWGNYQSLKCLLKWTFIFVYNVPNPATHSFYSLSTPKRQYAKIIKSWMNSEWSSLVCRTVGKHANQINYACLSNLKFWSFGNIGFWLKIEYRLSWCLGAWELLHFRLVLVNRLALSISSHEQTQ